MKAHTPADLTPRWENDILPGLIAAEERRLTAQEAARAKPSTEPRHNWGDRDAWRPIGDDPYSDVVNRDGYTPDGRRLFTKGEAA